jgi:hypothetical protein
MLENHPSFTLNWVDTLILQQSVLVTSDSYGESKQDHLG